MSEEKGAEFSDCGKNRYLLWRIWDPRKPMVLFIGLNPSKANSKTDDPTIKSVRRIAAHNGFGGFYMGNCFSYISTDPNELLSSGDCKENDKWIKFASDRSSCVVFAWGSFKVVKHWERDIEFILRFPKAKCLARNKNGSPKHPLFCKTETVFTDYRQIPKKP